MPVRGRSVSQRDDNVSDVPAAAPPFAPVPYSLRPGEPRWVHRFSSTGAEEVVGLAEHPLGSGSEPGTKPGGPCGGICENGSLVKPGGGGWPLRDNHDTQKAIKV